jgi:hypothetical protein
VTKGTTADTYVNENYRGGQVFPYLSNSDAVADLVAARIDAIVNDAPIVAWFASAHEGVLAPLIRPLLTQEQQELEYRVSRPDQEHERTASNHPRIRRPKQAVRKIVTDKVLCVERDTDEPGASQEGNERANVCLS